MNTEVKIMFAFGHNFQYHIEQAGVMQDKRYQHKNEFNTFKVDMPRQQEIDLNKLRNELMGYTDQELSNLQ